MKIVAINISHNPSVCVYENNKVLNFYNEERFVLDKGLMPDGQVMFQSILQKINFKPDMVCYSSFDRRNKGDRTVKDDDIIFYVQKQLGDPPYFFNEREHHLYHAVSAFYFSPFESAAAIVVDGGGACTHHIPYQEVESIYLINKKSVYPIFKHTTCFDMDEKLGRPLNNWSTHSFLKGYLNKFSNESKGGKDFMQAQVDIGFETSKGDAAGKVMGLSSYGYCDTKYNLDYQKVEIAKKVQEKTFEETCKLIDFVKDKNKNIVLSGGYFLNCSNNFKYVKKYPYLNFFVDPIPNDPGTAVGVAVYYDNYRQQRTSC